MLAISIIGVLAALAVPNYMEFIEKARVARAISELHGLAKDIKGFALAVGTYPNSLTDVGLSTRLDPWGTPYQYYRINCGTIDDITSLAKLKLRRKNSPRVVPANFHTSDHDSHILLISGGGAGAGGGAGPPCGGVGGARKDRFLVPINSDFDVYSMGKNLDSVAPLNPPKSQDDVIRASDGGFYGLARNF
jgi:general secretion pathway protein G